MRGAVVNMSDKMNIMSADTQAMNSNMSYLNQNIGQMSQDLHLLTRNVSPTMKGFHDMMPWDP